MTRVTPQRLFTVLLVGLALGGCQTGTASPAPSPAAAPQDGDQSAAIRVDDTGFHPNLVSLKRGTKAVLRFTRTSAETCASTVVFPDLKIERDLPLNEVVDVEVPTASAREFAFRCAMGMHESKVVVN